MKAWLKYVTRGIQWFFHNIKVINSPRYDEKRMKYKLVKKSHSIEKGFCLKNVKKAFGIEKVRVILNDVKLYIEKGYDTSAEEFMICNGILRFYFEKWSETGNATIDELKNKFDKILSGNKITIDEEYMGGTEVRKQEVNQIEQFENLKTILKKRDSVRTFSEGTVDIEKLEEAVELAQTAPSACNRQPSRVYIVEREKYYLIKNWVQGVGGFQEDVDKWLVVTSDEAAFDESELGQYIVSGSIFAGYLALILRTMGFATCMVQRNILYTPKYVRKALGITNSEQAICVLAVGCMQEEYLVPKACRYRVENIMRRV